MYTPNVAIALNTAIPASPTTNSVNELLARLQGTLVSKEITLDTLAGNQWRSCFTLTGSVILRKLYGIVTNAATLTNLTGSYFELYDGANQKFLTKNTAVLSNAPVGTLIAKTGLLTDAYVVNSNLTCSVSEPAVSGQYFSECVISQISTGANTYVRFALSTTDNPIAAKIMVYAEYLPIGSGALVAAP